MEEERRIILLTRPSYEDVLEEEQRYSRLPLPDPIHNKKRKRDEKPSPPRKRWKNSCELLPPFKLDTIQDLLYVAWNYRGDTLDWFTLWKLIPSLTELNAMIGLESLKQSVIDLILLHIQGLRNPKDGGMLHTVLYGSPGVGKTSSAHILAKIYCNMGFLTTDNVVVAKRSDFVKKWTGHSDAATMELLQSALGGVLFIDEAYCMGNKDRVDDFAKAAVDLLNQFLSEHSDNFVCIVAGYENDLDNCFFSINRGLKSRFPHTYHLDGYSSGDLYKMFQKRVKKEGWKLMDKSIDETFFSINKDIFLSYGRDIENFLVDCKSAHARRICGTTAEKKLFTKEDINIGLEKFLKHHQKEDKIDTLQMYI
uniref:ATPase family protein n=1 Tax=Marseillevirus LCMAC101 TaxID=2506602 RepID=A0A481YT49_9VIRU|nr:MAG: ATPase family protein [Marseillevirus LCMAC101]